MINAVVWLNLGSLKMIKEETHNSKNVDPSESFCFTRFNMRHPVCTTFQLGIQAPRLLCIYLLFLSLRTYSFICLGTRGFALQGHWVNFSLLHKVFMQLQRILDRILNRCIMYSILHATIQSYVVQCKGKVKKHKKARTFLLEQCRRNPRSWNIIFRLCQKIWILFEL